MWPRRVKMSTQAQDLVKIWSRFDDTDQDDHKSDILAPIWKHDDDFKAKKEKGRKNAGFGKVHVQLFILWVRGERCFNK